MRLYRRVVLATVAAGSLILVGNLTFFRKSSISGNADASSAAITSNEIPEAKEFPAAHEDSCSYDPSCPPPQILFRLHAETANSPPFACLNDVRLFDGQHIKKGFNLVSLNGSSGDVELFASFDVAASDGELISWLRSLPPSSLIVGVSFGDIAERVSADARAALASFGAVKVADWRGSSSYAILGQHGLQQHAYEVVVSQSFEHAVHAIEGCFDVPLGDVRTVNMTQELTDIQRIDPEKMAALGGNSRNADDSVKLGSEWKWCGMHAPCGPDEISMHFFTGEHKDDWPRLCVGGRMVFDHDLNDAGRGLNLVSIEPKTGRVTSVAHFDTYKDESSALEQWLENVPLGEVMAVVSFDEASVMLSDMAKRIFYEMGSSMIHRLKFRASWYFVGHKGLAAYSPFEDLNIPSGNNWAKPIKTSLCLPKKLDTWRGRPSSDKMGSSARSLNLPRRHFCLKHDRHGEFCSESRIDEPIRPKALLDRDRSADPVFNMPIVVAAGLSTDSLRICLESLMEQEGLNTQMIIVVYDKEYPENAELSSLFHVKSLPVNASDGYNSLILSAISAAFAVFPSATSVAVIEEDIRLSPDWLFYLSQTVPVLLSDSSIDIVQTFNPNGFIDTSGDESLVYRIEFQSPLYSYVITRKKYEQEIKYNSECCAKRGQWLMSSSSSLIPDVSRVFVAHSSLGDPKWSNALFVRLRSVSQGNTILNRDYSTEMTYDNSLASQIATAPKLPLSAVECGIWKQQIVEVASTTNSTSVVITSGQEVSDVAVRALVSRCFGLYFDQHFNTGVYKRVIRFVADSTNVFIVPKLALSGGGSLFSRTAANNSFSA
ncbi:ILEI domain-containing protein [Trichostrongylus colubriformis]|uniref:ILEI domain-containing protein n=1 Tax=Trichostrongylus colubriformis TaxID=6319 RepID=A0AAN8FC60_TRICO